MAEGDMTVIGSDSHFKGELSFQSQARINGKFDGQISGSGELQVSNSAQCKADVNAAAVLVDGMIEGNLKAKDVVKLNSKGTVKGDITASKMVMAEGASFYGQCAVGPDAGKGVGGGGGAPQPQGGGDQGQPPKK